MSPLELLVDARYGAAMKGLPFAAALVALSLGCAKKDIGQPCEDASECEHDVCLGGTVLAHTNREICTKLCENDADCPDAGMCIGGSCEATCSSQGDCPDETLCRDGLCLVECRSQDDCVNATCPAPGQVCEQ